jgi:cytochrome c oxidase assembly protein subunit 15
MVSSPPSSPISPVKPSPGLFRFAVLVALVTLGLVCIGGLVTSKGVGMAVPDWPTSFGYNMFALPISMWMTGGVFHEHTHRVWASGVGLLVVFLTRWTAGVGARKPLAWVGLIEVLAGLVLMRVNPLWKGEAHFLLGIGGVVLAAAAVCWKNSPAPSFSVRLAWAAFCLVQIQGSLGGLRVVLDSMAIGGTTGGTVFGMIHGCLGQVFFVLVTCLAVSLSPWYPRWIRNGAQIRGGHWVFLGTSLVFGQLLLGLWMRHQHAGLAIPDLPLAYGQWWPKTDPESLLRYASRREGVDSITALQIHMHLFHRINAVLAWVAIFLAFSWSRGFAPGNALRTLGTGWLHLVSVQFGLGLFTVITDRAADIATAHVAVGSMTLAVGCWFVWAARLHGVGQTGASSAVADSELPQTQPVR